MNPNVSENKKGNNKYEKICVKLSIKNEPCEYSYGNDFWKKINVSDDENNIKLKKFFLNL